MSMFANQTAPVSSIDEGTVMQIDPIREVCRVVTMKGQKLDSVYWIRPYGGNERQGDFFTPRVGDRVVLDYGLGYPIIKGTLPRPQAGSQSYPIDLDSGQLLVDTGSYAQAMGGLTANASKPKDSLLGDRVITSQGGGLLGILRAGSVILRSSKAAELFMSRLQDLVRIVSRNFEHFTDLSTDVYRNIQGRVYRYYGLSQEYGKTSEGTFNYRQYHGDVSLAEQVKDSYATLPGSLVGTGDVIFKEQVVTDGESERMTRTLNLSGHEDVHVTGDAGFTHSLMTDGQVLLTFQDENKVRINDGGIDVLHRDGHKIEVHSDGITLTHNSGHIVQLKEAEISLIHSDGAETKLDGSGIYNTFSGHFCNVTSGGVQLG
jgi:hypothetical protein